MPRSNDSSPRLPTKNDKRKQSLYFPDDMIDTLTSEAKRLDRSMSWVVQKCVKLALDDLRKIPSMNDSDGAPTTSTDED